MSYQLKLQEKVLVPKLNMATNFFTRFMGLMGKSGIPSDEALFFPKCNSIHTFFMRFPIDVVFVSESGEVVEVLESLGAWRMLLPRRRVKHTIELKAMRSRELGIKPGQQLRWEKCA